MIRSLFLSKKILIIIAVIFLLFVIVFYINNNKNLVVYKKSKGEVTLYINENVYKIDKNIYKININPGYYNYKVTGYVDNKKIVKYISKKIHSIKAM